MMDQHFRIVSAIVILLALIFFTILLRRLGIIEEQHGKLFSKLITQITLPALILFSMARAELLFSEVELALIMFLASLFCLTLGWLIGRALGLERAKMGPFILVTGFGSSSLLGFALVSEVFPNDDQAMAEAVILSALGVQPLLFTLGTMVAIFYGDASTVVGSRLTHSLRYFYSPIFLAFVGGILLSALIGPASHPVYKSIMDGVHVAGAANTFLVTMTVGLFLHLRGLREVLLVGAFVCAVKLVVMPVLVWVPTLFLALPTWQIEVMVLEASMPSAMLAVVLASAYGCDARFACKLVLVTTVAAVVTVPIMFELLR